MLIATPDELHADWVQRDKRWPIRGSWNWALLREAPELYREFNGIDFGHAHLAETLLKTQDPKRVERARTEVLNFIFSSPPVSPDEEQMAPTFTRLLWDVQKTFNWAHELHRSLYDLFASDAIIDKDASYKAILASYLSKPEAITHQALDLHGVLWQFPESQSFKRKFPKFNSQIWSYHWLQAAVYDAQLGKTVLKRQHGYKKLVTHYHSLLRQPPIDWAFMPMFAETVPNFAKQYAEAARIFDNLHMLHDNLDDVLSRPDLYPSLASKRAAVMRILPIYLHRNHIAGNAYARYRLAASRSDGHGITHHALHKSDNHTPKQKPREKMLSKPNSYLPDNTDHTHHSKH